MAYYPRSAWTSAKKSGSALKRDQTEIYIHWPASAGRIGTSTSAIKGYLQAWHRLHTKDRGWSDIAYNLGVDQNGDVWELRGIDRQCGGNGGTVTNRRGQAILAIMGMDEAPSPKMIRGIQDAVSRIRGRHPTARKILGHRDSIEASTSCPGPKLYALVKSGAFEPSGGAPPAKTSGNAGLADVGKSQKNLAALGYDPGPIDDAFGTKTATATKQFQTDFGITPADGRPGPATRTHLEAAVTILDDIKKDTARLIAFGEQIHWRVDTMPDRILDAPVDLEGEWKGQQSTLRRLRAWYAEDLRQIKEGVATSRAAILKAVQETGKAQGLTDDQVQAIAAAAAEAAARVSAEDVAEQLEVIVAKGD